MNISHREKRLLMGGGIIILLGTMLFFMFYESDGGGKSITRKMLKNEKELFEQNKKLINIQKLIMSREQKVAEFLPGPELKGDKAKDLLVNEVNQIYKDLEINQPYIEPPRNQYLEIDEYKFLVMLTKFNGPYANVCKLLDSFDSNGFIIDELRVTNTIDNDLLKVNARIKKLVQVSERELKLRQKYKSQSGRFKRRGGVR